MQDSPSPEKSNDSSQGSPGDMNKIQPLYVEAKEVIIKHFI